MANLGSACRSVTSGIAAVLSAAIAFTLVWLFRRIEARLLAFQRPQSTGRAA
ncbi:hypothetical protein VB636_01360 [Paracoccus sp. APAP_BH8]|uniref:hypothetical protein n=1 Tax=Paracoccus sp. APAP_BH8 TaxID=3110237 RepID=UPI002FD7F5D7